MPTIVTEAGQVQPRLARELALTRTVITALSTHVVLPDTESNISDETAQIYQFLGKA